MVKIVNIDGVDSKLCKCCNKIKPLGDFYIDKNRGGYFTYCKGCTYEKKQARRVKLRELGIKINNYKGQTEDKRIWDTKQREQLTDYGVRKAIYLANKKSIPWGEITLEMIEVKRKELIAKRERRLYLLEHPKDNTKICKVCNISFVGRRGSKYCSDLCRNVNKKEIYEKITLKKVRIKYRKDHNLPTSFICKECGKEIIYGDTPDQRKIFCSEHCSNLHIKRKTGRNHIERAKNHGGYYETFDSIEIFERDLWVCQLCDRQLNKDNRGKNIPIAPELDHIIPIKKKGSHTRINTQCLCRLCNGLKGDKVIRPGSDLERKIIEKSLLGLTKNKDLQGIIT